MERECYPGTEYHLAIDEFVHREVLDNVSRLVSEGAKGDEEYKNMFSGFCADRARELIASVIEQDSAKRILIEDLDMSNSDDLKTALNYLSIGAVAAERKVHEHWIVSDWLAAKLEKRGENIEWDFYGLTVWCRCRDDQAISMDREIRDIFGEVYEG